PATRLDIIGSIGSPRLDQERGERARERAAHPKEEEADGVAGHAIAGPRRRRLVVSDQQRIDECEAHHRRDARREKRRPHDDTDIELRSLVQVVLAPGPWALGGSPEEERGVGAVAPPPPRGWA